MPEGNMGTLDRSLRVFAGAWLLAFIWLADSWLGLIGVVPLVTGLVGYCPLYRVLHVDTVFHGPTPEH